MRGPGGFTREAAALADPLPMRPVVSCSAPPRPPGMSTLSTSLRSESAKYRKAARNINLEALLRKWAPVGWIGFFVLLFVWWRFF